MKKLITAVLLTAFCLQTAGYSAAVAATPVPDVSTGSRSSAAQTTTAQTQATASRIQTNAETKTTQSARTTKMKYIEGNPTSKKITGSMTEKQKKEAFKQILKAKGWEDYNIDCISECIKWGIIDEHTIHDTLAFIDLLSNYGYEYYKIKKFLLNQQKISRKEFKQICKNIEIISNNENLESYTKEQLVEFTPWDNLSKPIAPSFIKLVELDSFFRLIFYEDYCKNIRAYINNEEKMSVILQNYILLKNTGVLYEDSCHHVIRTIDWESFNGTNYALRLTNLMKETKLYTNDDIDKIVSALDWGQIKNDPPASSKAIIQKGYIKYLFSMRGKIPVNNTVLSNFEKILDLMKQNNMSEKAMSRVISNADWTKNDETLAILQILIKNNITAEDYYSYELWYKNNDKQITVYDIYESVQKNSKIADKDKEFIEQLERQKGKNDFSAGVDNAAGAVRTAVHGVGKVAAGTVAVATAPVWVPLLVLMFIIDPSTGPH